MQLVNKLNSIVSNSKIAIYALFLFLYELFLLARSPWFFSNQPWAEMAEDFIPVSMEQFPRNLFAADAGYVPIAQRFISWSIHVIGIPLEYQPLVMTQVAITSTAFFACTFAFPEFRDIGIKTRDRFAIALAFIFLLDFETKTYVNFSYFVAVPIIALSLQKIANPTSRLPGWAWLAVLFAVSKPALYPVVAILSLIVFSKWKSQRVAWKFFSISLVLGALAQTLLLLGNRGEQEKWNAVDAALYERIFAVPFYFLGQVGRSVLFGINFNSSFWAICTGAAFILTFVILVRGITAKFVSVYLFSTAFLTTAFNVLILGSFWPTDLSALTWEPVTRHVAIGIFLVLIAVTILLRELPERLSSSQNSALKSMTQVLLVAYLVIYVFVPHGRAMNAPVIGNAKWELVSSAAGKDNCLPIDPFGWVFGNECESDANLFTWDSQISMRRIQQSPFALEIPTNKNLNIHGIGLFLNSKSNVDCRENWATLEVQRSSKTFRIEPATLVQAPARTQLVYFQFPEIFDASQSGRVKISLITNCSADIGLGESGDPIVLKVGTRVNDNY